MGESKKTPERRPEDVIAAFDRERHEAQELNRRHAEFVRNSRRADQSIQNDFGRNRSS